MSSCKPLPGTASSGGQQAVSSLAAAGATFEGRQRGHVAGDEPRARASAKAEQAWPEPPSVRKSEKKGRGD
uniref:Uncharacterized protein n=1 Tax=Setaria italica TaxID=4555 RepID=K3Z199_SETIT